MISNNDGGDLRDPAAATPEGFLDCRTRALAGSHVDAIFYCTHHSFNLCTHNTSVGEIAAPAKPTQPVFHGPTLIEQGRDCLQLMTDFCHAHDMELFWSMRMNDTHDARMIDLRSRFKRDHPEWLLGDEGVPWGPVGDDRWWCALNYEIPEVRERAFRIIEEVCRNYDVDGIELDFFRHTAYFPPQRAGRPPEPRHLAMLTDLMRRVHALTVKTGEARGRRLHLAVRVPDSVSVCRDIIGLDIERWLSEGFVDLLVPGGYWHLAPWSEMIALGHAHGAAVYPCVSGTRIRGRATAEADDELLLWRGEALNIWGAGGDGVYAFNLFEPDRPEYRELGDPALLQRRPRIHATSAGGSIDRFLGAPLRRRLGHPPIDVPAGERGTVGLDVFETPDGDADLTLRLRLSDPGDPGALRLALNGVALADVTVAARQPGWRYANWYDGERGTWVECRPTRSALRHGSNELSAQCGVDTVIQEVQLEVRPRRA